MYLIKTNEQLVVEIGINWRSKFPYYPNTNDVYLGQRIPSKCFMRKFKHMGYQYVEFQLDTNRAEQLRMGKTNIYFPQVAITEISD
jgi:hypothetical protein